MYSLITHQSKRQCPYIYARRLEYWNREFPIFSFYIDWFTRNYKDQTDSKLPGSGLCTHRVLQGEATEHWGVCVAAKIKHPIRSPASCFWISERINFDRITNSSASSDSKWMKTTGYHKHVLYRQNTSVFCTY